MKLDRMDLADLGSPERLAAAIWEQAPDMTLPVPVEDVARQLDITEIRYIETDGFEGGLIAWDDKSEGVILVNQAGSRQRRRFTVGHELGHFLNPWHKPRNDGGFRCTTSDTRVAYAKTGNRRMQMEVEANEFAAALLMPRHLFQKDLRSRKGLDVGHIVSMARKYDTSKEATARRYAELQDEVCAFVVIHEGKVLRTYRHREFPFVNVSAGDPVPAASVASVAASCRLAIGEASDWNEVDRGIWIDSRRPQTLLEQFLPQRGSFGLLLLTSGDDAAEKDEEDTVEAWEMPKFRQ